MPPLYLDSHENDKRREASFNAPAWALLLTISAILPQFFVSILWWPFASVFLFAAFVLAIVGLVQGRVISAVLALLLVLVAGPIMMIVAPLIHLATYRREHPPQLSTIRSDGTEITNQISPATPEPTPTPYTPPPDAFAVDVKYSQRAAVAKYPSLGVKGSPLNSLFISRLNDWKNGHDPRLDKSNWPERLADDCVARP